MVDTGSKGLVHHREAARAMPHTLRAIDGEDKTIAELEMIVGFDDDLAGEATPVASQLHGLLTQIHSSLERVLAAVPTPGRPDPAGTVRVTRPNPQGRTAPPSHAVTAEGPRPCSSLEAAADVLFAMLRDGTFYEPQPSAAVT